MGGSLVRLTAPRATPGQTYDAFPFAQKLELGRRVWSCVRVNGIAVNIVGLKYVDAQVASVANISNKDRFNLYFLYANTTFILLNLKL